MGWEAAGGDLIGYSGVEVAEPVELTVKPDGVTPNPVLIAVQGRAILVFEVAEWDQPLDVETGVTTVGGQTSTQPTRVRNSKRELGVLRFHDCFDVRLGRPNDEGFSRHPLSGSAGPWLNIVRNSRWAAVSFDHSKPPGTAVPESRRLTHYLLSMKENTFECLARGFSVERVAAAPYEVAFDLLS